ncbi:hypothetical protein N7517_005393 [Penicillium concentricum]|uniref:Uncharacterized protein n=1 Tax=Penicillium concentricum TaxID=293559 RepID=A0A9W9S7A8_9EURO|nr:uncharacterized protein N7517_005393 [Penicillium concentricum]KAJ5373387.1 hypothetical protein N7517_005393 [Penicillium concentricum]
MAESAEQLRKMQILQMADLGTARREMISTADLKKETRTQLANIESKRYLDQRDEAQLSKWANLHTEITDTRGMEELDDINSGQSHRANLHAMLHPNGSQPRTYANHPYPLPSTGRGGGVMGKRGRGGFVAPPPTALPPAPTRISIHATVGRSGRPGRPGRPGPRGRSTTMSASIHLDPALNCNNDDSDARDRGRGRGRGKGKGRSNAQEQVHFPSAPIRVQRQPQAVDFAARISQPGDFMSVVQSRRATEMYKKPIDTIISTPMQMAALAPKLKSPNESKVNVPLGGTPKKGTATVIAPSKPGPSPMAALKPPSHAVLIEKTTSFKPAKTQDTSTKISLPHIGPYLVETPSPLPRVVPIDKTASFKSRKPHPSTSNPTEQHKKPPPVVAVAADGIQWKISPGEQPRKKGAASSSKEAVLSERSIPLTEDKKTPVVKVTHAKYSKRGISPGSQKIKTNQKVQSQDLLSDDDSPVNAATKVPRPLKTVAIQSPGTAELAGLQFATKASESVSAKSIDEVIFPKITNNDIPEAHSHRNDQSQEDDSSGVSNQQIIAELRDIREYIRAPHRNLATTRDIERILEAKLLQLVATPSASATAPTAPAASDIGTRLDDLAALIESFSALHQRTKAGEASSAARRDVTPFEGHRSPPPPSSSSNSPPSADKRAHKLRVPGLSPTGSENSDIISHFEFLQVSEKLAAPLQPQRAVPTPTSRPLKIPKKANTSDASVQVTPALGSRPKEAAKKPLTLNDSIFAGPVGSVTSVPKVTEPNARRSQTMAGALSSNHPNIPSQQDERAHSTGVRTIGPAPYKPRVIGPAPSVYEQTTLRDLPRAQSRTVSVQQAAMDTRIENLSSVNVASGTPSSGTASEQAAGRLFSMPDPATIQQPQVKTDGSILISRSHRY